MPTVSAIVLNYRTPKDTLRCVRSLQKQTIASEMEILIVDNHSEDDSIGFIRNNFRKNAAVSTLETRENLGYGQGNELGIRSARGEFILIINPDNELEPQGLEKMIAYLRAHPDVGILGPQLIHEDGSIRDSYRTFPTAFDIFVKRNAWLRRIFPHRMIRYLQHAEDPNTMRDVDWLAGACLFFPRKTYEEIGGFDPRFFLFFEDTDLCRRCWKIGKRVVYFPDAKATDRKHRLSEGGILSLFFKWTMRVHVISAFKYFWKWRGASLQH